MSIGDILPVIYRKFTLLDNANGAYLSYNAHCLRNHTQPYDLPKTAQWQLTFKNYAVLS